MVTASSGSSDGGDRAPSQTRMQDRPGPAERNVLEPDPAQWIVEANNTFDLRDVTGG